MQFHVSHHPARPRGVFSLITNDATPKQIAAAKLIDSKGSHSGAGHFVIERAFVER
jgi:hypothetical protein